MPKVKGTSLLEDNPELAKEWHPTKNGNLTPANVSARNGRKVWWKCPEGEDHEWQATVGNRNGLGRGCPICSGTLVVNSNCLATLHPDVAAEWHPTKNGALTPNDVTAGSSKKVWWKCAKGSDHEWLAPVAIRSNGSGCAVCADRVVVDSNCLATTHPELAKEWHPTRNGTLLPTDIVAGSSKKVWWQCSEAADHEWKAQLVARKNGSDCPSCAGRKVVMSNCLSTTHPELAAEWHPTKNGQLRPTDVIAGARKKVWWKCPEGEDHVWKQDLVTRKRGNGCPICSGYKVVKSNCLSTTHPELASEWHPTKNKALTPEDVHAGSRTEVWWKCSEGVDHEWKAPVHYRGQLSSNCPICSRKRVVPSTSLASTHPKLCLEWHPTKNGQLTPLDFLYGSDEKVWWKCPEGEDHVWQGRIAARAKGGGCPVCSGDIVVKSTSLAFRFPKIAEEWHPSKNGALTPQDITPGSDRSVWWKCSRGEDHEWNTAVYHRTGNGTNCPFCNLTPQSRQELIVAFELKMFFPDINPRGFKAKLTGRLKSIDIFIPQFNLGIEFDGSYWHKDKRALDRVKTKKLQEAGFQILRIREEPLKKISDIDIISPLPYNGKMLTNAVLSRIQELHPLPAKMNRKIDSYFEKEGLQNEAKLDAYIDQILKEKAEQSK